MLAQVSNSRPSPLPLPAALLAAELGPVVMADDPCEAAFGGADPTASRKYYRARYYSPHLGRFASRDPMLDKRPGRQRSLSLHEYSYVGSSPLNWVDPTGRVRWKCRVGIGVGGKVGVAGNFWAKCRSKCEAGMRIQETGHISGVVFGAAVQVTSPTWVPDVDITVSDIELQDNHSIPDARNLEGPFGAASIGFAIGGGIELGNRVRLGDAEGIEGFGFQAGFSWPGFSSVVGAGNLVSRSTENCCEE